MKGGGKYVHVVRPDISTLFGCAVTVMPTLQTGELQGYGTLFDELCFLVTGFDSL